MKKLINFFRTNKVFSGAFNRLLNFFIKIVPDKTFVKVKFLYHMGYPLNLDKPKTLNEKINWLKLNDRRKLHTICADKYEVRKYVSEKIGAQYLVPLYFETTNVKDIIPEDLPNSPCIIKTNHDSSGGFFIYDKEKINWKELRDKLNKRLKQNFFWSSREWQYKNIKPRIIVEKLLQDKNGNIPNDYKLHCFNSKVRMISVDEGRGTDNHHRNWYSTRWEREPYKWSSPKGNSFTDPSETDIAPPVNLEKMIKLSEILAKPFCYARVDWYEVDGVLFFGEITFHHDGGYLPIIPKIWDERLGTLLKLETT